MKYRLKTDSRFTCGQTSFGLSAGVVVEVIQADVTNKKVLIDFGDRIIDWFPEKTIERFEPVAD